MSLAHELHYQMSLQKGSAVWSFWPKVGLFYCTVGIKWIELCLTCFPLFDTTNVYRCIATGSCLSDINNNGLLSLLGLF